MVVGVAASTPPHCVPGRTGSNPPNGLAHFRVAHSRRIQQVKALRLTSETCPVRDRVNPRTAFLRDRFWLSPFLPPCFFFPSALRPFFPSCRCCFSFSLSSNDTSCRRGESTNDASMRAARTYSYRTNVTRPEIVRRTRQERETCRVGWQFKCNYAFSGLG